MAFLSFKTTDVQQAYERVITLLKNNVKQVSNRTGWHQYIGENMVGDVATAQGILLMHYIEHHNTSLPSLLDTLRAAQHHGNNNPDEGGWSFLSNRDTPTVEATVWALLGLIAGGEVLSADTIVKGKTWLKENQNEDGGWGPRKLLSSRTYITFLACRGLIAAEPELITDDAPLVRSTVKWIQNSQNEDGGWGERIREISTPIHTAFAILTLCLLGKDYTAQEIRKGVSYLYKKWSSETMWQNSLSEERYDIPKQGEALGRVNIDYFPTPWVVIALLEAGESVFNEQIFSSVQWLLRTQKEDGSWILNIAGSKRRLWAVHDAILAIKTFMKKIVSIQTADRLLLFDNVLVVSNAAQKNGFFRQALLLASILLVCGIILGVFLSSLIGLNATVGSWFAKYWAWIILGVFVISMPPLIKFRILSLREAIYTVIIPIFLVIIQVFLSIH